MCIFSGFCVHLRFFRSNGKLRMPTSGCQPAASSPWCRYECSPRVVSLADSPGSFQRQLCSKGCWGSTSGPCSVYASVAAATFRGGSFSVPRHDFAALPVSCTDVLWLCGWRKSGAWAMQSRRPCSTWFKVQFCFTFVLWCEWIQRFKLRVASREFQKGRTRTSLDELESIVWEEGCISLRCQYCENLRWCARAGAWSKVECAVGQRRPHGIQEVSGETSWGSKRSQYESSHLL